jgi:hypothetical protein
MTLEFSQLAGRRNLCDIIENISDRGHRLCHTDSVNLSPYNLARTNEGKPYVLHEGLF